VEVVTTPCDVSTAEALVARLLPSPGADPQP